MKKRLLMILTCLMVLSAAALAAAVSVTLNAGDSVETQAAAFAEYLDSLSEADQWEWQQALEQMLSVLPSSIMRCEMLEKIEHTDPFCGYPDVIRALKAKEDGNVKP